MSKSPWPETPLHLIPCQLQDYTLAALHEAVTNAKPDARTEASFVNVDTRVLLTLIRRASDHSAMLQSLKEMTAVAEALWGCRAAKNEYGWNQHDDAALKRAQTVVKKAGS